jgi:hypothetical protein
MTSGGDWVEQARRLMETLRLPGTATASGDESAAGTGCPWCPHCQAAAIARGERPELTAAVADILAATAGALRQFAGDSAPPQPAAEHEEPEHPAPPAVQRIELS